MSRAKSRLQALLALALCASYVVVLARTAPEIGFVRDEGYYFKAAEEYFAWFSELAESGWSATDQATIDRFFSYNHEHPALVKLVQGALHEVLHVQLEWTSSAQGFRSAGFLYAALALFGTFALGQMVGGGTVGLIAALFLSAMPRFFFDAHLATFDVPITAMWVWSLVAFVWMWRSEGRGAEPMFRAVVCGLVFGLALATKLNALFLPFIFIFVAIIDPAGPWWPRRVRDADGRVGLELVALPWSLVIVAVVGVLTFLATWPWLWPDPWDRVVEYLRFHAKHEHYPISYFGELYVKPPFPWSFPWVMTLFTVPSS